MADKEEEQKEESSEKVSVKGKVGEKPLPSFHLIKTSLCWLRVRWAV